ncbi:MAG: hypothetical protein FWD87_01165 [Spirochaetaceae bacterium]|nr:hypothetical protein [Spirochaetaceae bacterium]
MSLGSVIAPVGTNVAEYIDVDIKTKSPAVIIKILIIESFTSIGLNFLKKLFLAKFMRFLSLCVSIIFETWFTTFCGRIIYCPFKEFLIERLFEILFCILKGL